MPRYFIELAYDGTAYNGWQVQKNASSVQAEINSVLSTLTSENVQVTGAGRTDTGVHARQMFCHFDGNFRSSDHDKNLYKLNSMLPEDIAVLGLAVMDDERHARFDAVKRRYEYRICLVKDPFEVHRSWYNHYDLDIASMNEACNTLIGEKDFAAFSKKGSDNKTDICHVVEAGWSKEGQVLTFSISADRFLRNMVRAIVGTLVDVGSGKVKAKDVLTIMESGERSSAGLSAPACGLYLSAVEYPYEINFLSHV